MKKLFTLAFSVVLMIAAQAQTIYTAAFTGSIGSWTTVDNSGVAAGVWQYKTGAISTPSTGGSTTFASATAGSGYVVFNSDAKGNDGKIENTDLISPPINCSTQGFVFLEWDEDFA